ncbi:hypothetical protein [Acidovorax sp. CCYZU-2555]|uniref:hypothetical protein n=1 Tax=Acidovorax sp. CCYZU-2555 TaxID=2835042 RepID=UPI001BD0B588|nr:hypothetical protein [Acidovorax sp. CCYZU-2555]MBS7778515.1 hypothetical protein [Acidovorax sp. CCYZU-2555]
MRTEVVDPQLKFEIKNVRPVELNDLTESLRALGNEYQDFISREHPDATASEVRLYVNEVKSGSVIATLCAMSPLLLDGISYVNTVVDFTGFLKHVVSRLSGDDVNSAGVEELLPSTLSNVSQIVEPIAKDGGSQLNIGTLNVTGNVYLQVPSKEANVIQNQARRIAGERKAKTSGKHEKVVLHWFQARADKDSRSGDRAKIESISSKAVKTICATESLKSRMVLSDKNPFNEAFIVDVVAETINGKVVVYKVIELHDRFMPEEDEQESVAEA